MVQCGWTSKILWWVKEVRPKDYTLYESIHMKWPEKANLQQQITDCLGWGVGEGNGTPLQYSCLENPMDGEAWKAAVHGVVEGWTRLSDFTFTFHFHALEKEMATHSSVLAWRIPGTEEPGGLPSVGSHRVADDWSDLAVAAAAAYHLLKTTFLKQLSVVC